MSDYVLCQKSDVQTFERLFSGHICVKSSENTSGSRDYTVYFVDVLVTENETVHHTERHRPCSDLKYYFVYVSRDGQAYC